MGKVFIGNFKGPKGDKGDQGAQGIQGIQGPAGPTGEVDENTPIEFTEASTLSNINSGESISTIFGKLKKIAGSLLIGAGSTLLGQNLTAARALVSDVNGKVGISTTTATELQYLSGLTKNAQEQFNQLTENFSSHTHNYAASASVGGSANSAVKLDSSAGSATQPVYFSGGKPVACTYTLGKSVPSNAVFTDTLPSFTSGTGTRNTSGTKSGTIIWYKYGRVVIATIDVILSDTFTQLWGENPVASGLPEAINVNSGYFPFMHNTDGVGMPSYHLMSGTVYICGRGKSLAGKEISGTIIYMSKS